MSEEMHPSAGSGRDQESQKNLLRKLINTMKEGHKDDKQHRKADFAQSVMTNHLLESILDQKRGDSKDAKKSEQSKKGDDLESKREQNALFSKLAKLPSALKDGANKVKDAPGNLMGALGKKVKGFGGMLGGLAKGAGVGILAIVAVAGLMSAGVIDAQKVKDSVLTLLSIGNEMDVAKLATLALFAPAMKQIALGLGVFALGSAAVGASQSLLDFSAEKVKNQVLTLLSIGEELSGKQALTLALFKPAMLLLSAGLAVFAASTAFTGLTQLIDVDLQKVKDQVGTLLSIGEHVGSLKDAVWLVAFAPAMTLLSAGIIAFGAGTAIAGIAQLVSFSAEQVKTQVLTLLSIGNDVSEKGLSFLKEGGEFFLAMTGLGAGLAVFGVGGLLAKFASPDMADKVKNNVLTLLSLTDQTDGDIEVKSTKFKNAMGNISDGLKTFTAGNLASALGNVGVAVLNFLSGGDNKGPIQEMLSIADKEVELNKAASGIERMASALEKVSDINIGAGSIDIEGMLDSFGHLPRLLGALAHGNPAGEDHVEFETFGRNKKIDFGKGILDPNLKVPEISKVMTQVNSSLGLGAPRNAQMSTVQGQNTELTGTGTGGTTVMDASTNVQNNTSANSTAIYGDATPATNSNDGLARVAS